MKVRYEVNCGPWSLLSLEEGWRHCQHLLYSCSACATCWASEAGKTDVILSLRDLNPMGGTDKHHKPSE